MYNRYTLSGNDDRQHSIETAFDWRAALKSWRGNQGMTQSELARRSGLSLDAIKAYEAGRRRPSRHALQVLIHSLGIPRDVANPIFGGAGYAIEWETLFDGRYLPPSLDGLQDEAEACAWPAFVTNQVFDVVAQNAVFERLFGVDLSRELLGFGERNLLAGITHDEFAGHLENWDEVVTFMCGLVKEDPRWRSPDLSRLAPALDRNMQRLLGGNPARIKRLADLWEHADPIPVRVQHTFRIVWRVDESVLAFSGRLVIADLWTELHWNEWIPADRSTWEWVAAGEQPDG